MPEFEALSDDELRAKTDEFRARLADGDTLDDLVLAAKWFGASVSSCP